MLYGGYTKTLARSEWYATLSLPLCLFVAPCATESASYALTTGAGRASSSPGTPTSSLKACLDRISSSRVRKRDRLRRKVAVGTRTYGSYSWARQRPRAAIVRRPEPRATAWKRAWPTSRKTRPLGNSCLPSRLVSDTRHHAGMYALRGTDVLHTTVPRRLRTGLVVMMLAFVLSAPLARGADDQNERTLVEESRMTLDAFLADPHMGRAISPARLIESC